MTEQELINEFITTDINITNLARNNKMSVKKVSSILRKNGFIFGRSANKNCILHLKDAVAEYIAGNHSIAKLSNKYKIGNKTISDTLKEMGISVINEQTKSRIDNTIFKCIDSEEKAYWLGFLYADGYIGLDNKIELALAEHDKTHLNKFNAFLKGSCTIHRKEIKCNNKICIAYRISVRNKKVAKDLIKLGCTPRKSLTLEFPTEQQVPKKYQISFIRGYFDGDGCVSFHRNSKNICSCECSIIGTKNFLIKCAEILKITKYKMYQKGKAMSIKFNKINSFKVINTIYNNSTIHLDRKYKRASLFINTNNAVPKSDLWDY